MSPGTESTPSEQARKASELRIEILLAAFHDQIVRIAARDDVLCAVCRRAQHAHRMIVTEHDVLDRFVGDRAYPRDDVLRHDRRRLRVDHEHAVVTDHDAGVRIAFRRVRICTRREFGERDLLRCEIALRRELLCHVCISYVFDAVHW